VGGVSGRPTRDARGAILHALAVATVEGTQIHRVPVAFAGCRRNMGLGRSVSPAWGSFPGMRSHRRQRVLSGRRGGERGQRGDKSARTRPGRRLISAAIFEDTSFARSRGPCTSIPTELPWRKPREVGRSIRYRGRANLRKQEEPAPGPGRTDDCAARRVSPLSG
jgi:hypothetical protein